jgi:DNA-binding IclR family transcriptional regulator
MRTTLEHANQAAKRGGPQSVGRIFIILESLAGAGSGATLSELAADTGAPKTSLVNLLAGLTAEGCLRREDSGRYVLGPRFISLAIRATAGRELIEMAHPVLVDLVADCGETALLGTSAPDAELAIYLDRVESSNPIRYAVTVGERRELYCTAVGKVLLAHFDETRLNRYLDAVALTRFTPHTPTSKRALRRDLARIRRDGIARTSDQRVMGASGLAAPVYGQGNAVVAVLAIAGPSERMKANSRHNERCLLSAAADLTRLVGGPSLSSGENET